MGWGTFGKKNVQSEHGWFGQKGRNQNPGHQMPEQPLMAEKKPLEPAELMDRINRLDGLVKHKSSLQESKDLFPMGGIVYRNSAESQNGSPIGKVSEWVEKAGGDAEIRHKHRYNLTNKELDMPALEREIAAAHGRGEETYVIYKSDNGNVSQADLIIIVPAGKTEGGQ